jgi:uncharacterized protein YecE (DUF72 family)
VGLSGLRAHPVSEGPATGPPSPDSLMRRMTEIRIGTSGYSFPDWVGQFYPPGIEKGKMLDFYIQHFKTVEINSTYYRIPHPAVMRNMERKTPPDFEFIVKTHSSFTHERRDLQRLTPEFLAAIEPIAETGKLKGLLAQFPFSFHFSPTNLDYLLENAKLYGNLPLYTEFRHDSWLKPEVKTSLAQAGIGYCNVDEPALPHLIPPESAATTGIGYVRLHGRNGQHWWAGGPLRYDYSYTDDQLREWVQRLDELRQKAAKVFLFFNNCHLGQAVKDAFRMQDLLGKER